MRAGTDDQFEARGPGLGTGARSIAGLDFRQFYAWRPAQNVARRRARWHGISAEIHCVGSREPYEARGRYPVPALTFCEHGRRKDGESRIEGSPTSTVRNVHRRMLFSPAGAEIWTWSVPIVPTTATTIIFEPQDSIFEGALGSAGLDLAPRAMFEDATIFTTALKLKALVESPGLHGALYAETVGLMLVLELLRAAGQNHSPGGVTRGGLAAWQQRTVREYIEDNLCYDVSLKALGELARITPEHFCRAFRQSFGTPPHRYVVERRIERAKSLLADGRLSITDVALASGFGGSAQFARAFRKYVGNSPTDFRRSFD